MVNGPGAIQEREAMVKCYTFDDAQWECIRDLLPGQPGHVGPNSPDTRRFVDVVLYRYRAGISWRDLPERFGDFRNIHQRHSRC